MEIKIENLTLGYDEILFDKLNLTIHSNTFTTLLGKNGCGKTSLIKALIGEEKYSGTIKYDNLILGEDTKNDILNNVSVILSNNIFLYDNIYDDMKFNLEKIGFMGDIDSEIKSLLKELNLEYLIDRKVNELSDKEKSLGIILSMIVSKPKILMLDCILDNIDKNIKEKLIKHFKKNKMTVLNITNNVEDILLSDEVIILNKKVVSSKNILKLLEKENEFSESNFKLPFMADLSNKLKFYDLVDKIILDENELVDSIWK